MKPGPSRTVAAETGLLLGISWGRGHLGAPRAKLPLGCSCSKAPGGGHAGLNLGISSTVLKPPKSCTQEWGQEVAASTA